jgi:hypothetical protein
LAAEQFNQQQRAAIHGMNRDADYRDLYSNQTLGLAAAQNKLAGAQQLGALGRDRAALGYADAQARLGVGDRKQALKQRGLDVEYDDWLQQVYRHPQWQLDQMVRGLQNLPNEGTLTTEGPSPNYLAQGIGALGGIAGLGGSFGLW